MKPHFNPADVTVLRNGQAEAAADADHEAAEARAAKARKKRRCPLAPYKPFPVAVLPEPIRAYVIQAALAMGCDHSYFALPALAVAAGVIGNTRVIQLNRDWSEPAVAWSAVIANSGTLKSPAAKKVVAHLYRLQQRLLNEYRRAKALHDVDYSTYQDSRKKRQSAGSPDLGVAPVPPALRRVVCSDTTIEKLAEILEDNPRGTLVVRDELAGLLGNFTRYKGKGGGTDLPLWLEAFNAAHWMVDRRTGTRPSLFIPRAAVSITGSVQPGVFARVMTAEYLDAGFAARLLTAMPPKVQKKWSELEIDPGTERAYADALDKLLALDFDDDDGEKVPHVLRFSTEAKALWVDFYNDWAQKQAAVEGEMAAALSKLEAYAARFTLLHHVVTHAGLAVDDRRPIGVVSVEAGIILCRWFAHEAARAYAVLAETEEDRGTRRIIEWIRSRGGIVQVRELQQSSRKYSTSDQAEALLEALVQAGHGLWVSRPPSAKGGRPTRDFRLIEESAYETYETTETEDETGVSDADETER